MSLNPNEDDRDFHHNENDVQIVEFALDNRMVRPEIRSISEIPLRNSIERTLAQNHPLMVNSGELNTERNLGQLHTIDIKCHNFPDVVPHNDNAVSIRNTLNSIRSKSGQETFVENNKIKKLRAYSPDLLSSESEADISQYHAAVEADFKAVSLISNGPQANCNNTINKTACTRKSGDDVSSLDSISNHSFDDDDLAHNLASLSPSSSLVDGLDNDDDDCEGPEVLVVNDDDFLEGNTLTPTSACRASPTSVMVPQYSAAEERRDSRNWQKIVLPDGRMREIDMRVIEPYKRVLSHGGYLKAGGHNAIVIFCACHLPDRSRADYNYVMDNLFLYVVKTLEQLVTEDYVLIYLHGGSNRRNVPPFPWLKKCYQLIDRRLRKSLKNLYLVHPTFWIKSLVWMGRPFVSAKFWRKLIYVKTLQELSQLVAVEKAAIPDKVKQYDVKYK